MSANNELPYIMDSVEEVGLAGLTRDSSHFVALLRVKGLQVTPSENVYIMQTVVSSDELVESSD